MKIIIATGIYPPATSGPAQYAAAVESELQKRGHQVVVLSCAREHSLPSGIRHLWYFLRLLPHLPSADFILALDTFSVGFPAVLAGKIFGKKVLVRTGGDFLYEQYTERTAEPILLSEFYLRPRYFTGKERAIFWMTRWTLQNCSALIFSTIWQRDIWLTPYNLFAQKIFIVVNRFDAKISDQPATKKNFIFATRRLQYKNIERFTAAFATAQKIQPEISLEIFHDLPHAQLLEKLQTAYAAVMPSLGEVSPHFILDALRCNKPFILTSESGFAEQLKNVGVLAHPLQPDDLVAKILWLVDDNNYQTTQTQVRQFNFTHSWAEITEEILRIVTL